MERRNKRRIVGGFEVEIIYKGKSYKAVIDNLSERGVSVTTIPTTDELNFTKGASLDVKFKPQPEETLILHCKIQWSCKIQPHGLTHRIGMEIIDPPWDKSNYFI